MKEQQIKVLLVEDEVSYADLLQIVLGDSSTLQFVLTHAKRLEEALQHLAREQFDVVLLDLTLPDRQGLLTYAEVHAMAPAVPIIVLTGLEDQTLALQAVREGAQDYLFKGHLDGKMLTRVIRYAIERTRAAEALRQSEEFFRLISENVTDLIAVLDREGRRLYNSPSYKSLLGNPDTLTGSDSFLEIHPEDREQVKLLFQETVETGVGHRSQYRMVLKDGSVRHIESQGNAIKDATGRPVKVVVVSRDITEQKEAVEVLRSALSDLKISHEEVKTAQLQLIQAEKLEAVSTFAAGVAHEVKNPLQTIILGVDYLANHFADVDATAAMILTDMGDAVHRADSIIRGLVEFSAYNKRDVKDEDLSFIIEQSFRSVETELANFPIVLVRKLSRDLPQLKLDFRTIKHVFINLFMYCIRAMAESGGTLRVRTFSEQLTENLMTNGRASSYLRAGDTIVVAEVEDTASGDLEDKPTHGNTTVATAKATKKENGLGLTVLKKIIELYGGIIQITHRKELGNRYTIIFRAHRS